MADLNPTWLKVLKTIGLPVPLAPNLKRADTPWSAADCAPTAHWIGDSPLREQALQLGWNLAASTSASALVLDAGQATSSTALASFPAQFHAAIQQLSANGRVVLLSRGGVAGEGYLGLAKSLAKELGSKGITINCLEYTDIASPLPWLAFLLSGHSSYITGQRFCLSAATTEEKCAPASLQHRTIAVTGAAQGIGLAMAQVLRSEGATVLGIDRPGSPLAEHMAILGAKALELDITDANAGLTLQNAAMELGGLDGIIHNAGMTRDKRFRGMDAARWESVLEVNLRAPEQLTQYLLEKGLNKDGRVVFLSSISGVSGNAGQTNYATAKAALIRLTSTLAEQTVSRGIRVNAIAPGFIATPMTEAIPFAIREVARRMNALAQAGEPGDVARLAAFLMRPEAGSLNGQTVRICGLNLIGR